MPHAKNIVSRTSLVRSRGARKDRESQGAHECMSWKCSIAQSNSHISIALSNTFWPKLRKRVPGFHHRQSPSGTIASRGGGLVVHRAYDGEYRPRLSIWRGDWSSTNNSSRNATKECVRQREPGTRHSIPGYSTDPGHRRLAHFQLEESGAEGGRRASPDNK